MTINQISIFLENKFGRLNEILSILSKENIHIIAATVADTSDYGILRLITSNQQKAFQLLKDNGISANLNAVLAMSIDSSVGSFAKTIEYFTKSGISIEYMYCFSIGKNAILVLRSNDIDVTYDVVRKYNINCISEEELINL